MKFLTFAAICCGVLLIGCKSTEPTAQEVFDAYRTHMVEVSSQAKELLGDGAIRVTSVAKKECAENPDGEGFVCVVDVETDITGYGKQRQDDLVINVVRSPEGVRIAR